MDGGGVSPQMNPRLQVLRQEVLATGRDLEGSTFLPGSSLPIGFQAAMMWAAFLHQTLPPCCAPWSQLTVD